MKTKYFNILLLIIALLQTSCKDDNLSQSDLDIVHVYYISDIKKPNNTVVEKDVAAYSVYDDDAMLISWKNDYQIIKKNKISFFTKYSISNNTQEQETGDELTGTPLKFSFNEDYDVETKQYDPTTGKEEIIMQTICRAFIFEGNIDETTHKGSGNLTVIEHSGETVVFEVSIEDTTRYLDNEYHNSNLVTE